MVESPINKIGEFALVFSNSHYKANTYQLGTLKIDKLEDFGKMFHFENFNIRIVFIQTEPLFQFGTYNVSVCIYSLLEVFLWKNSKNEPKTINCQTNPK